MKRNNIKLAIIVSLFFAFVSCEKNETSEVKFPQDKIREYAKQRNIKSKSQEYPVQIAFDSTIIDSTIRAISTSETNEKIIGRIGEDDQFELYVVESDDDFPQHQILI